MKRRKLVRYPFALVLAALILRIYMHTIFESDDTEKDDDAPIRKERRQQKLQRQKRQRQCTQEQLGVIKTQLPPDDCEEYADRPQKQRCSFSYATRCPDPVWIDEHYSKLLRQPQQRSFVGIFVGCNKGMDAINALRMGSGDPKFSLRDWRDRMVDHTTKNATVVRKRGGNDSGVCRQAQTGFEFKLPDDMPKREAVDSKVYCIEPSPATYRALSKSSLQLGYHTNLIVTHAAVSIEDGSVPFPDHGIAGKEQKSISDCTDGSSDRCVDVKMYSLDSYVSEQLPEGPIHFLSVDVEGFDQDVLLGGKSILHRVHYIEFEYNWMGSWQNQSLSSLIDLLDEDFGFTCYWPGINNGIWRITGCFLDHFDIQFWSNVACVNRNIEEARGIAQRMESMFDETLKRGDSFVMSYSNRKKMRQWRARKND